MDGIRQRDGIRQTDGQVRAAARAKAQPCRRCPTLAHSWHDPASPGDTGSPTTTAEPLGRDRRRPASHVLRPVSLSPCLVPYSGLGAPRAKRCPTPGGHRGHFLPPRGAVLAGQVPAAARQGLGDVTGVTKTSHIPLPGASPVPPCPVQRGCPPPSPTAALTAPPGPLAGGQGVLPSAAQRGCAGVEAGGRGDAATWCRRLAVPPGTAPGVGGSPKTGNGGRGVAPGLAPEVGG